jgi:hypothetical protein
MGLISPMSQLKGEILVLFFLMCNMKPEETMTTVADDVLAASFAFVIYLSCRE